MYIGSRGGTSRWVNGSLDEIKVYNRALNPDEIWADMDMGGKTVELLDLYGNTIDFENNVANGSGINISVTPGLDIGQGVILGFYNHNGDSYDEAGPFWATDGQTSFEVTLPTETSLGLFDINVRVSQELPYHEDGTFNSATFWSDTRPYTVASNDYTVPLLSLRGITKRFQLKRGPLEICWKGQVQP